MGYLVQLTVKASSLGTKEGGNMGCGLGMYDHGLISAGRWNGIKRAETRSLGADLKVSLTIRLIRKLDMQGARQKGK